jgi:predicted dehydrogenase
MTRIGILSVAHGHAYSYVDALLHTDGVEVVGITDDDAERGKAFATRFGIRSFESAEALLAEHLDGVVICSENSKHRPLAELAAKHTPNILCEKPISTSVEDARAMIDACAAAGAKLQIAFPVRFAPPVMSLKQLLDQQVLGKVYSLKTTNRGTCPGGWFVDKQLSGGGAVIDHTVHVIDLLRWFFSAEVTEVYAEVGVELFQPGLGIDDAGMLSFKLSNGAYGTLDTSWSRTGAYPTWGDVTIDVLGERGLLQLDTFKQNVAVYSNQAAKAQWINWGSNMDAGLIADFVDMVRTGREPFITGHDGLKALEVALAAYRSAETGQPVLLQGD